MGREKISIPKDRLYRLYYKKMLSPYTIGEIFGCIFSTITNRLKEYKIPLKSHSAARIRYEKFNFSGPGTEKAYLVGFRLGDLNVYKTSSRSEVIIARTNTTSRHQIALLKRLFGSYGHVQVSVPKKGHDVCSINCYLDNSFSFLLPKHDYVEGWIKKSDALLAAFTAGYSDAEGSFGLNQGRARFQVVSYDKNILRDIHAWLHRNSVNSKYWLIYKKGETPLRYKFSKDLWRLTINDARGIVRFTTLIKPYLRHAKRRRDMQKALTNIEQRRQNGTIS